MKRCCPELLPEKAKGISAEEQAERKRASADDWISEDELREAAVRAIDQVTDPQLRRVLNLRFGTDRDGERRTPAEVAEALGGKYKKNPQAAHTMIRTALRSIPLVADDPSNLQVIFEDDDLLAVCKPPFLRTVPVHRFLGKSLMSQVLGYTQRQQCQAAGADGADRAPSATRQQPMVLHRLDQNTSGVVLCAKTKQAASFLHERWHGPSCRKVYLAIGTPLGGQAAAYCSTYPQRLREVGDVVLVDAPIGPDPAAEDHVRRAVNYGSEGQSAATRFEVLSSGRFADGQRALLLRCSLEESGRTHQIRVHAAHVGCPLLGDDVYNPLAIAKTHSVAAEAQASGDAQARVVVPRVALHAWRLYVPHPRTGRELLMEAALPADLRGMLALLGMPEEAP